MSLLIFRSVQAQEIPNQNYPMVDYGDQPTVDIDSDGLTDQGELQLYHTDQKNVDTDDDGVGDGVEVLAGSDPLDPNAYPGVPLSLAQTQTPPNETPWAWYVSRTSGLAAFLSLYVSIFLGLTLRIPLLRKIFSPIYSMSMHCWISLQATLLAFFHGGVLTFDKLFDIRLADVFIPFASKFEPNLMAMGIISFYIMVILVVTSYGRKFISQKLWRGVHFFNVILYVGVLFHAAKLGTDMKNPLVFGIFMWANAFLIFVMLWNIELRIGDAIRRRKNINGQI